MLAFISNHSDISANNHLHTLISDFNDAEVISLCSGHLKLDGVTRLADELKKAVDRGARVVFYSNRKHTKKDVSDELAKLKIEHIIVDDKSFYLHTKLFFVEAGDGYSAYIGSANITKGGLTSNEELSVVVRGTKGDLQHSQITKYLAQLDLRCRVNRTIRTAESGGKSRIKTPARKQRKA